MKYRDIITELNPMQNAWEMNQVLLLLEEFDIKTVLEIGMYQGGSFATWSRALRPDHLIGITIVDELAPNFREMMLREGDQPRVDLIFKPSQSVEACEEAASRLSGKPVDFLFIDGAHEYAQILSDWNMYSPLVRAGGVIGIHDVSRACADVYQFWEGIVRMTQKSILVADASVGEAGLGCGLVFV